MVTLTMVMFGIGAGLPLILLGLLSRATLMRARTRLMSAGKFGKGLYMLSGGGITYPGSLIGVAEGTVEMWIAPRFNGSDAAFATSGYSILSFNAANGDFFTIGEDSAHQGRIADVERHQLRAVRVAAVTAEVQRAQRQGSFRRVAPRLVGFVKLRDGLFESFASDQPHRIKGTSALVPAEPDPQLIRTRISKLLDFFTLIDALATRLMALDPQDLAELRQLFETSDDTPDSV